MDAPHHEQIVRWPGRERSVPRSWMNALNKVLARLRSPVEVRPRFDPERDMVTIEMAGNLEVLLTGVLAHHVPGDLVELGTFTGATAAIIGSVAHRHGGADRAFHVYDRFDIQFGDTVDVEKAFITNMETYGVPMPVMHKGDLLDMVPRDLPARIAFAHIDCGFGGDPKDHAAVVRHCLAGLYDRIPTGGVIVLMDHHDPGRTWAGKDCNPGARMGADAFLRDKPERFEPLYGGVCSHAYMRKS